ncbi:MAG: metabolite traffic protein EboE, partial [Actinomycetota bacterium]
FEDAASAVQAAAATGIPIVKAQLSCALRIERPYLPAEIARLESFVETRFLHQVRERTAAGTQGADDLDRALDGELPAHGEWRVHFHIPVHHGGARSTRPELIEALAVLLRGPRPVTRHLEVETYTWSVLPADRRPAGEDGLVAGLVAELTWVRERLEELGLEETP